MENELILVAGVSGSGRTTVMQVLIDEHFIILENVSSSSIKEVIKSLLDNEKSAKIAIVLNMRNKESFEKRINIVADIEKEYEIDIKSLLLTANTKVLINRYQEFRKIHPITRKNPEIGLLEAIKLEKENITFFKSFCDYTIDTSELNPEQTKSIVCQWLKSSTKYTVNIRSFGFKYGIPVDSDFVVDVRFLPNPHYVEELKPQTGKDQAVYDYVFSFTESEEYFQAMKKLVELMLHGYQNEGRMVANLSIGCTGGKHRSVAFVERLAQEISEFDINVKHIENGNW